MVVALSSCDKCQETDCGMYDCNKGECVCPGPGTWPECVTNPNAEKSGTYKGNYEVRRVINGETVFHVIEPDSFSVCIFEFESETIDNRAVKWQNDSRVLFVNDEGDSLGHGDFSTGGNLTFEFTIPVKSGDAFGFKFSGYRAQ